MNPKVSSLRIAQALFLFRIAFGEVIGTQIGVDLFGIGQKMIDHNQDGMCHSNDNRLITTAGAQAEVLRIKVRSRGVGRAPRRLRRRRHATGLTAPCLAAAPLAAGDIVARTEAGPGRQMLSRRKRRHRRTDLGQDDLRRAPVNAQIASNRWMLAWCGAVRIRNTVHREWRFPRSKQVEVVQQLAPHEAVMVADAAVPTRPPTPAACCAAGPPPGRPTPPHLSHPGSSLRASPTPKPLARSTPPTPA